MFWVDYLLLGQLPGSSFNVTGYEGGRIMGFEAERNQSSELSIPEGETLRDPKCRGGQLCLLLFVSLL